ncbi:hypothetical protein DPMN_026724 [Dreissena polymorpha]|uniref:Reverse transcriptase domain-containing protein n=1 Tax=Dreissena polymorpha TaxID=45954 RepID=A0A9D4LTX7_DREPO|nr:hypothetical protein DPMN_026724 [Dreissena polymorpha]
MPIKKTSNSGDVIFGEVEMDNASNEELLVCLKNYEDNIKDLGVATNMEFEKRSGCPRFAAFIRAFKRPFDTKTQNLQKDFDTVDHSILLMKLRASGLGDDITMWLQSYLSDWKQLVDVSGTFSSSENIS